jgi:hypothetical protein
MPAKIRKNKLEIEYSFDFELIGIRTSLRGYKLAWHINQGLQTRLVKEKDLEVHLKKGSAHFDHYAHRSALNALHLFRNRTSATDNTTPPLVPEYPHFDFILMTQSEESLGGNRLQEYLRNLPSVEWAALIPLSALKSKENFIF